MLFLNRNKKYSFALGFGLCFWFVLTYSQSSEASLYNKKGLCVHEDKFIQPGGTFQRGCDTCFCHEFGFYCFSPMKPTSWPKKCRRVRTDCGYTVVYKENPLVECRAYSWVG